MKIWASGQVTSLSGMPPTSLTLKKTPTTVQEQAYI